MKLKWFVVVVSVLSGCGGSTPPRLERIPEFNRLSQTEDQLIAVGTGPLKRINADGSYTHVGPSQAVWFATADGREWRDLSPDLEVPLWDAAYGKEQFVAVGSETVSGTDGFYETQAVLLRGEGDEPEPVPGSPRLRAIAFGANTFVAVSWDGELQVSPDGRSWTPVSLTFPAREVLFANDRFVVSGANKLGVSTDGSSWEELLFPELSLVAMGFANGQFVGSGCAGCGEDGDDRGYVLLLSRDLMTWERLELPARTLFTRVAGGNGRFLASSGLGLHSSSDGRSWTHVAHHATDVAFFQGRFFASSRDKILSSTDGDEWTSVLQAEELPAQR